MLELACILKNVYAIGFGIALAKGENYAAHKLIKYFREYASLGIKDAYRADAIVSCYSDKSRNKTFGKAFAKGEKYDEATVEGLNTAKVIEKHNLFKSCPHLRKITKTITTTG
jgi:glycerol-3-phosphate dehydrogenase